MGRNHAARYFVGLLVIGALTSWSKGKPSARVDCGTPGPGGVDCVIKRTAGEGSFKACWDLEITCANGGKMVASACQGVKAGAAEGTANLPAASFSNQDQCDAPKSGAVKKLVVTTP